MSRSNFPQVPVNDLKRQAVAMTVDLQRIATAVIDSGWYVLGPGVAAFEEAFAAYCGTRSCIGVASGSDALELAVRVLTTGTEARVATVANAGMYSTAAIIAANASPTLVDIDPETLIMSPAGLESVIDQVSAVIVTHLYGRMADQRLFEIAKAANVPVIEDCAQAHGATRHGLKAGSLGAVGCFSFYPTKNLGALGDGGAMTTNDDSLAAELRSMRQYGWRKKYEAIRPFGRNSRLDELQAAILTFKLPKLDQWNDRRRAIITRYRAAAAHGIHVLAAEDASHVGHLCVIRCEERDGLRKCLTDNAIGTDVHYPIPDHRQEALRGVFADDLSLMHTERATREVLTIPCFPELTDHEIDRVCDALSAYG